MGTTHKRLYTLTAAQAAYYIDSSNVSMHMVIHVTHTRAIHSPIWYAQMNATINALNSWGPLLQQQPD